MVGLSNSHLKGEEILRTGNPVTKPGCVHRARDPLGPHSLFPESGLPCPPHQVDEKKDSGTPNLPLNRK